MKIAFRHVPFTPAQRAELDEMARAGGYETLWYADGATPQAEELKDCEVLMGYFPPALLPELPALKWLQTLRQAWTSCAATFSPGMTRCSPTAPAPLG